MEDFMRLLAEQQSLSGGTSLISMYIDLVTVFDAILTSRQKGEKLQ